MIGPITAAVAGKALTARNEYRARYGTVPVEFRVHPSTLELIDIEREAQLIERPYRLLKPERDAVLMCYGIRVAADASVGPDEVVAADRPLRPGKADQFKHWGPSDGWR